MDPTPRLLPIGQIVLLWPGYDPTEALHWPNDRDTAQEVTLSQSCRLPRPDLRLAQIADWMQDYNIQIISYIRRGQRKTGPAGRRWHGRYRLLLGVPQ